MEIDSKLEEFKCEIPAFSGLEVASLEQIAEIDARRAPGIIVQRYVLNSMVYAHRAKQHMHYMARGTIDPAYSRSRDICLNSARMIIRTERLLEKENIPYVLIRLRFSGMLYTIAMAAITLLVDLCFSKKEGDSKADFMDACSILDAAREHSPLSEKLLASLRRFLAKHQVKLPPVGEREDFQTDPRIQMLGSQDKPDEQKEAIFGLGNFDDIYRQFDGGVDINMLDWNNFFSELD